MNGLTDELQSTFAMKRNCELKSNLNLVDLSSNKMTRYFYAKPIKLQDLEVGFPTS